MSTDYEIRFDHLHRKKGGGGGKSVIRIPCTQEGKEGVPAVRKKKRKNTQSDLGKKGQRTPVGSQREGKAETACLSPLQDKGGKEKGKHASHANSGTEEKKGKEKVPFQQGHKRKKKLIAATASPRG